MKTNPVSVHVTFMVTRDQADALDAAVRRLDDRDRSYVLRTLVDRYIHLIGSDSQSQPDPVPTATPAPVRATSSPAPDPTVTNLDATPDPAPVPADLMTEEQALAAIVALQKPVPPTVPASVPAVAPVKILKPALPPYEANDPRNGSSPVPMPDPTRPAQTTPGSSMDKFSQAAIADVAKRKNVSF